MEALPLPTFFVIGAGKSGTSALHEYLRRHPQVDMTARKECHCFLGPRWRERVEEYRELFPEPRAAIRGDASPGYTVFPRHADTPDRMRELVPGGRLIYILRDPVDRAIAQYAQHVTTGTEQRGVEAALDPADPACDYINISRYAAQVENYLRVFDREALLVIDQADLRSRRRETLSAVFAHVGADPDYWSEDFEVQHNVRGGGDNVLLGDAGRRLKGGALNRLSRRLLPASLRRPLVLAARRRLGTEVRPEVTPELRAAIAATLVPDAQRLRELTGKPFAGWSV